MVRGEKNNNIIYIFLCIAYVRIANSQKVLIRRVLTCISAACSKTVALLLLLRCLLLLPIFVGVLCLVLVLLFITLCPSSFSIILIGKRQLVVLIWLPFW